MARPTSAAVFPGVLPALPPAAPPLGGTAPLSPPPPAGASLRSLPRLRAPVGPCCCHRNHVRYHLPLLMPAPVPSAGEDPQGSTQGSPGHRLPPILPLMDEQPFLLLSLRVTSRVARETHPSWNGCSFRHGV